MRRNAVLLALSLVLAGHAAAQTGGWPRLDKPSRDLVCADALRVAQAMFRSDAFYLYAPPERPVGVRSMVVLKANDVEISGGDALIVDAAIFEKISFPEQGRSGNIYWQTMPDHGLRLALTEVNHSWRGDTYTLYSIDSTMTQGQMRSSLVDESGKIGVAAVFEGWRPPLMFHDIKSGAWLIDVGHPAEFLGKWLVYSTDMHGFKQRCSLHFHPRVRKAEMLLPAAVQKFETLLDQTMGRGERDGTLHSTAHLRNQAQAVWANAALRPWALSHQPYNTIEEVEAGLLEWSRDGESYASHYAMLKKQQALALQALADYYKRNFQRSPKNAKLLAVYVMDIALRTHYSFHSEDPEKSSRKTNKAPNPWHGNR